jgi:hypothetical protein
MKRINLSGKQWVFIGSVLVIGLYSLFQARFIILGPSIKVYSPSNGASLPSPVVTVTGKASNIAFISLNDNPIYVDKNGNWSEKLIAPTGLSIMTVRARDRFGRSTEKQIEVMVN